MRKLIRILSLALCLALGLSAAQLLRDLPANPQPYVEKKYAGWSGVLRAWIYCGWECAGSFTRWLNGCAARFEKAHPGVYVEFTQVPEAALANLSDSGLWPPDLVFFSPEVEIDAAQLARADFAPEGLDEALRNCGGASAAPVAMGGYLWIYNPRLCAQPPDARNYSLPDDARRAFSKAGAALLSEEPRAETAREPTEYELDLGLAAASSAGAGRIEFSEAALEDFIDGKIGCLLASQSELARLIRLRDAGRGPDWACAFTGGRAYSDQLLMLGVLKSSDAARAALAAAFAAGLYAADSQRALSEIGAIPVTTQAAYPAASPYAPLERWLRARPLELPEFEWAEAR